MPPYNFRLAQRIANHPPGTRPATGHNSPALKPDTKHEGELDGPAPLGPGDSPIVGIMGCQKSGIGVSRYSVSGIGQYNIRFVATSPMQHRPGRAFRSREPGDRPGENERKHGKQKWDPHKAPPVVVPVSSQPHTASAERWRMHYLYNRTTLTYIIRGDTAKHHPSRVYPVASRLSSKSPSTNCRRALLSSTDGASGRD